MRINILGFVNIFIQLKFFLNQEDKICYLLFFLRQHLRVGGHWKQTDIEM